MKLYFNPISGYSRKALFAAYEKNIAFEPEIVNLLDPEAVGEYRKVNPFGKLPTLALDNGWKIPESSIIVEYFDTKFEGGLQVIPRDLDLARQSRFFDRAGDNYLLNPVISTLVQRLKPEADRDSANIERQHETIQASLGLWNGHLDGKAYTIANNFTQADFSAFIAVETLQTVLGVSVNDWPNIKAWHARITERPSWKRIAEESQPYAEKLAAILKG